MFAGRSAPAIRRCFAHAKVPLPLHYPFSPGENYTSAWGGSFLIDQMQW